MRLGWFFVALIFLGFPLVAFLFGEEFYDVLNSVRFPPRDRRRWLHCAGPVLIGQQDGAFGMGWLVGLLKLAN